MEPKTREMWSIISKVFVFIIACSIAFFAGVFGVSNIEWVYTLTAGSMEFNYNAFWVILLLIVGAALGLLISWLFFKSSPAEAIWKVFSPVRLCDLVILIYMRVETLHLERFFTDNWELYLKNRFNSMKGKSNEQRKS